MSSQLPEHRLFLPMLIFKHRRQLRHKGSLLAAVGQEAGKHRLLFILSMKMPHCIEELQRFVQGLTGFLALLLGIRTQMGDYPL